MGGGPEDACIRKKFFLVLDGGKHVRNSPPKKSPPILWAGKAKKRKTFFWLKSFWAKKTREMDAAWEIWAPPNVQYTFYQAVDSRFEEVS